MSNSNIDIELKKIYTKLALKWCKENLGINHRKRKKLILDATSKDKKRGNIIFYGRYCPNENKITVYLPNCNNVNDLVGTVIHEYTHYLQSSSRYRLYEKIYYYSQNPYERQARRNEEKYTDLCADYVVTSSSIISASGISTKKRK